MSTPDDNPFSTSPPPELAPVEVVVEAIDKKQDNFEEASALALSRSWPYAGVTGLCFLAVSVGVGWGVFVSLPFPHFLPRFVCGSVLGGIIGLPACVVLLFSFATFRLRKERTIEQYLLAIYWQRKSLVAAGIAILAVLAVFFFLIMMNVYDYWYDVI